MFLVWQLSCSSCGSYGQITLLVFKNKVPEHFGKVTDIQLRNVFSAGLSRYNQQAGSQARQEMARSSLRHGQVSNAQGVPGPGLAARRRRRAGSIKVVRSKEFDGEMIWSVIKR